MTKTTFLRYYHARMYRMSNGINWVCRRGYVVCDKYKLVRIFDQAIPLTVLVSFTRHFLDLEQELKKSPTGLLRSGPASEIPEFRVKYTMEVSSPSKFDIEGRKLTKEVLQTIERLKNERTPDRQDFIEIEVISSYGRIIERP